ncbi:MAG: coiled-coil domain-containing protein [Luteibaculaceae bacterium]
MSDSTKPEVGSAKNNNLLRVFLIISVLLNVALIFVLFSQRKTIEVVEIENVALNTEATDLKKQLSGMLAQYDSLAATNDTLSEQLQAQRAEIETLLAQVEKGKNDKFLIAKYKKEAATLRKIMQGYVKTIDSLNTLNINLTQENTQIKEELGQVSTRKVELERESEKMKEIITTGKVLQATLLTAEAINIRNNGSQSTVTRANRADAIKTCLTLGENRIAEKGRKTIYVRIISPDGKVLAKDDSQLFTFNKVSGLYSEKRTIDYDGKPIETCVFYETNTTLIPGQYIVEVYESETLIARTTTDLK